ncbi:alpha/beta fold hydrolase [Pusillimonas sp. SM2304]|uniref:alpha/beta fold hydrolase n=1 Tax=Pusillimonas sp. SM2304 TaxID=3073241 RepID=UPI0028744A46|nr:alpha/beta fold hydrolase [Pusillimonas sp. SM2304]MDS1141390.1 alpha/beta fold hydrolase [Pusillimonas sp. SM2304]
MSSKPARTSTFVLVHGAWHGGWCWSRVAERLRADGHIVYTPTLTGLGERSHLLNREVTLQTFVDDIVNVLAWEDLTEVVLVGHSFAGLVITGVADAVPQRLSRLVYLDAFILESGISTFDSLPAEVAAKMEAAAQQVSTAAPALPPPKPKHLGLAAPEDIAFVQSRLTPQPLAAYQTALQLKHAPGNGLPCTYLHCISPPFAPVENTSAWVKSHTDWRWEALDSGHDAMVSHPDRVCAALLQSS